MKSTVYLLSLAVLLIIGTASAADRTVKIGILTDMSGVAVDDMGPGQCWLRRWQPKMWAAQLPA
jgi:hypothetical protein